MAQLQVISSNHCHRIGKLFCLKRSPRIFYSLILLVCLATPRWVFSIYYSNLVSACTFCHIPHPIFFCSSAGGRTEVLAHARQASTTELCPSPAMFLSIVQLASPSPTSWSSSFLPEHLIGYKMQVYHPDLNQNYIVGHLCYFWFCFCVCLFVLCLFFVCLVAVLEIHLGPLYWTTSPALFLFFIWNRVSLSL